MSGRVTRPSRREFLGAAAAFQAARRPPNVLFLFADDQRFNTIGALGNPVIQTPNLDALVKNGVSFTHCFAENPICTPSRAALLTGTTGFRNGVRWFNEKVDPQLPTWAQTLRQAGYATFYTGKWHNDGTPQQWGFERVRRLFPRGMGNHEMTFEEDGHPVSGFSSELFAGAAIEFLRSAPLEPFFCFVSFTAPHDPRTPPGRYRMMYNPARIPLPKNFLPLHPFDNGELEIRDEKLLPWPRTPEAVRGELANYYGMISHLDEQVGRILAALDQTGLARSTIVVFSADNGLAVGCHGLLGKMSMYDHSVRVPLIIRGPGAGRPGSRSSAMCYVHDIFPTVCELAGVRAPSTVEGRSVFSGPRRDAVFASYRGVQRMVRTERWKLIRYPKIGKTQLFDMAEDPDEMHDRAERPEHAARVAELGAKLTNWQRSVGDTVP